MRAAVIIDSTDGHPTDINPLAFKSTGRTIRCAGSVCNYRYLDQGSCPPVQNNASRPHYNPAHWGSADSSCQNARAAGALGPALAQPGEIMTGEEYSYMLTSCCWAFMKNSGDGGVNDGGVQVRGLKKRAVIISGGYLSCFRSAHHVLRAHMGPTCGEPNEIELTIRRAHGSSYRCLAV